MAQSKSTIRSEKIMTSAIGDNAKSAVRSSRLKQIFDSILLV